MVCSNASRFLAAADESSHNVTFNSLMQRSCSELSLKVKQLEVLIIANLFNIALVRLYLLAYFTGSAARATGHSLLTSLRTWVISCEYRQHEFHVRCCPQVDEVRCCLHIVHIARSAMFHSVHKYTSINVWLAFSSSVFNCFQGSVKVCWNSAGLQRAGWMPSSKSAWCSKGRRNYCI